MSGSKDIERPVNDSVPRHVRFGLATTTAGSGTLLVLTMLWAAEEAGFNQGFYGAITIGLGLTSIAALLSERLAPVGFGMGLVSVVLSAAGCVKIVALDYLGGF